MKNNMTPIKQLQGEMNERMKAYAGKRYEGTEFHIWYRKEVADVLDSHGIKELRPSTWKIVTDMSEGVSFFADKVADVNIEFKRDKRFKYGAGRGVVLRMKVAFRQEIMDMTCDAARRFLLEEKREECVKRVEQIRDNALKQAQDAAEELARLKELKF